MEFKKIVYIIVLILTLEIGFSQNISNDVELISANKIFSQEGIEGYSIILKNPQNKSLKINSNFRNWRYQYFTKEKKIEKNSSIIEVNISLNDVYQNYKDTFVLEKISFYNNETLKDFIINEKFSFNNLNRKKLGEDIYFENLSYDEKIGKINMSINYNTTKNYEFITFYGINIEDNNLLFEKIFPINKGSNELIIDIYENLSSFYIKADYNNKVAEFSELNNVAFYPFSKKEICGDRLDNDGDNLIDESCDNSCPDIEPGKNRWVVLECFDDNSWEVNYFKNVSNLDFEDESTIEISKIVESSIYNISSNSPINVENSSSSKNVCRGILKSQQISTKNNSKIIILVKGENSTYVNILKI